MSLSLREIRFSEQEFPAGVKSDNLVGGKEILIEKWKSSYLNNLPLNTPGWGLVRTIGRLHSTTGSGGR